MSGAALDAAVFDALQDSMGDDFVEDLVNTFLEEAPAMLADLKAAALLGEADRFRRAAHSLKSNANVFGAAALAEAAREAELGEIAQFTPERLAALEALYRQAAAALVEWRDG